MIDQIYDGTVPLFHLVGMITQAIRALALPNALKTSLEMHFDLNFVYKFYHCNFCKRRYSQKDSVYSKYCLAALHPYTTTGPSLVKRSRSRLLPC